MRRVVVVGAGSAGCVVAARLSEDADTSVVLLEAGPDYPDVHAAPDDIRSAFVFAGTDHDWGYISDGVTARADAVNLGSASAVIPVLRGKVVGGSSAVNGTSAMRSTPSDFDRWVAAGNDEWSWSDVLPFFRVLENDPAPGEWHGHDGPLPIRRFQGEQLRPVQQAFLDACAACGIAGVEDHNAPGAIGAGPIPLNQLDGVRQSAAHTYINPVRHRANLTVRSDVLVDRVEITDDRARGVLLADGELIEADEVVLAAGAYGSPAILMRSGVGPAAELTALGITPVADLPAVGKNLRDHPMIVVAVEARTDAVGALDPPVQTMLTIATQGASVQENIDIEIALFTVMPDQLFFGIGMVRPQSVGEMCITSRDPAAAPRIRLNFFAEPSDVESMVAGVRAVRALIATDALAPFVGQELFPGPALQDDAVLEDAVRATPTSYAHATGTCRMGPHADTSVVGQTGRVHGFENLWVVDASIMPALPTVPTNTTTMMLAERCASWMR
ncbi:MAG: GMC family oxidoreductase N-terminal domain-containing protein [Acidimicrobiales bacterium]